MKTCVPKNKVYMLLRKWNLKVFEVKRYQIKSCSSSLQNDWYKKIIFINKYLYMPVDAEKYIEN